MNLLIAALVSFVMAPQDRGGDRPPEPEFTPVRVEPRIDFWRPVIHGVVAPDKIRGLEFPGESTRVSLEDDLALDPVETVALIELELFGFFRKGTPADPAKHADEPEAAFSRGGFRLSYWRHSWSGSTVLRSDLSIDGELFPVGTPADQTLTVTCVGLDGVGLGPLFDGSFVAVEAVGGLRYFLAEYELESPAGDLEDAEGGLGINLGLGVSIRPTPWCFAAGRVSWSGLLGVPIHEASAFAGVDLGPLHLEAGYRGFWADKHSSNQSLDLSLEGPYLGIELRF